MGQNRGIGPEAAKAMVVRLRDQAQTKDVDWLAWEDPFIYSRNARELKAERERSDAENRKRLAYVIPMLQVMCKAIDDDQQLHQT